MTAQRQVTIQLDTKLASGGDAALKKVGSSAAAAAKEMKGVEKAADTTKKKTTELASELDKYVAATKRAAAADRDFARNKQAVAAAIDKERAALARNKALDDERVRQGLKQPAGAKGGGGIQLGKLGESLKIGGGGPMLMMGAAFGMAKMADNIAKGIEEDALAGPGSKMFAARSFEEKAAAFMADLTESIPIIGFAFAHSNEAMAVKERRRQIAEKQLLGQQAAEKFSVLQPLKDRERALAEEGQLTRIKLLGGAQAMGESAMSRLGLSAEAEAAMDEARGRGESTDLIQQRFAARQAMSDMDIRGRQEMAPLEAQRGNAAALLGSLRSGLAAGRVQEGSLSRDLGIAQQKGLSRDAIANYEESLNNKRMENQRIIGQLSEAEAKNKDILVQRGTVLLSQSQQRIGLLQQEHGQLSSIIQSEKERLQSGKESFGLMDPEARQQAVEVARKLGAGQDLSKEEIDSVRGIDVFQPALKQLGAQRAGPEFDEIVRTLGADRRLNEAEAARVNIANDIKVQIDMGLGSMTELLTKELEPKIRQMIEDTKLAYQTAAANLAFQHKQQNLALAAGGEK